MDLDAELKKLKDFVARYEPMLAELLAERDTYLKRREAFDATETASGDPPADATETASGGPLAADKA
jgi:hypothetical protein